MDSGSILFVESNNQLQVSNRNLNNYTQLNPTMKEKGRAKQCWPRGSGFTGAQWLAAAVEVEQGSREDRGERRGRGKEKREEKGVTGTTPLIPANAVYD
ncbi:hypothetical protein Ahy_A05g022407 isoform F [Arachis hypogaea]|uniref:Uncharacterized protein n=1 Tax=Arachis hypogaea TaxID=3818 RepID=A0A445D0J9_ARAHY|nr:hypothetical protein Ahy_A05g022407 isoform F [Arachis hypogaea]